MVFNQLDCFLTFRPTCQPTILKMNQSAVGFLNHLACALFPWAGIPNQSVKTATFANSCNLSIFPHFPVRCCSRSLLKLLVSWGLRGLRVLLYVASWGTDPRASSGANKVEEIYCFWGLNDEDSCAAVAAECNASVICSYCSLASWHFVETITALRVPIVAEVVDFCLEPAFKPWCKQSRSNDHRSILHTGNLISVLPMCEPRHLPRKSGARRIYLMEVLAKGAK